jgi:hypothetical protein
MEREVSNPENSIAASITTEAFELLENPSSIQVSSNLVHHVGNLVIELRGTTRIGVGSIGDGRYLYIYDLDDHDKHSHGLKFSIELSSLLAASGPAGFMSDASILDKVIGLSDSQIGPLAQTVRTAFLEQQNAGICTGSSFDQAQLYFADLLSKGTTHTYAQRSHKFEDGTRIYLASNIFDGPLEHLPEYEFLGPKLTVSLSNTSEENEVVVEVSHDDTYESFCQHKNKLERLAAFLPEKNVMRNDDGAVIGVSSTHREEQAVIEAARVMALRIPRMEYLEPIAAAVRRLSEVS